MSLPQPAQLPQHCQHSGRPRDPLVTHHMCAGGSLETPIQKVSFRAEREPREQVLEGACKHQSTAAELKSLPDIAQPAAWIEPSGSPPVPKPTAQQIHTSQPLQSTSTLTDQHTWFLWALSGRNLCKIQREPYLSLLHHREVFYQLVAQGDCSSRLNHPTGSFVEVSGFSFSRSHPYRCDILGGVRQGLLKQSKENPLLWTVFRLSTHR